MERIKYRITLDTHRTGIQRTLQGFETADNMSRCIAVNLTAGGDTYEIPLDHVVAMVYVSTPESTEPSINECVIDGNTIIYDVLPIVEEGITEMQFKLLETSVDGAVKVLASPRIAVEVTDSRMSDSDAEQTTTFTALENAIARANGVYDSRLIRVEIDDSCVFRVYYADGTIYENFNLYEALFNGNALLSESWAIGGTGIRDGEDTNNSKYYSSISASSAIESQYSIAVVRELIEEAKKLSILTNFNIDFIDGNLKYDSYNYTFEVDESTGELAYEVVT